MGWLFAGFLLIILMVLAEKALIAVTPHELEMLRAEGTPSARRVVILADEQNRRALAAVAIGRMLAMVIFTVQMVKMLLRSVWLYRTSNYLNERGIMSVDTAKMLFVLLYVLIAALVIWRTGQINLKRTKHPIAGFWLERLGILIQTCTLVFRPFLPKQAETKPEQLPTPITHEAIATQQDTGKRDIEMLKSIARFGDVTVKQVMQPQPKIVAIEAQMSYPEVLEIIRESEFSRIPVYEDDLDNIIGILYLKDLVDRVDAPSGFDWTQRIRREVFIVPETKPVSELLHEFKHRKIHLALVVDEYGGTAGLVTMEDILEEVTGEIRDEFDEENEIPPYRKIDDASYIFAGATMINDVCQITGIDPETFEEVRDDADTIAGLALTLMGEIPAAGAEVQWGQYLLTIEKADNRRIEEVKFTFLG